MKTILSLLLALALALPAQASVITTSTASVTISGQTITFNVAAPQTPATAYYRLAYDSTSKKIDTVIFSKGTTKTVYSLYCATTWAEVQAFATANALTGLPATDPGASH